MFVDKFRYFSFGFLMSAALLFMYQCEPGGNTSPDGQISDGGDSDKAAEPPVTFPKATAPSCACKEGVMYGAPHSPNLDKDVDAVSNSHDGKLLAVGTSLTLHLFMRATAADLYTQSSQTLILPQRIWRLLWSPDDRHLAVVMDKQVLVLDVAKALQTPEVKDVTVVAINAPDGGSADAADATFLGNALLAVGFYAKSAEDPVLIWSIDGASSKQVLALQGQSVQSLASGAAGDILLVGGREAAGDAPRALVHVFVLSGDASGLKATASKTILLKEANTYVTTLDVSPDNQWLALGTSPDVLFQRAAPRPVAAGDHGHVRVLSTQPLGEVDVALNDKDKTQAHGILVRRVMFRADGQILATLGVGSPRTMARLHLWKRQDDTRAPFVMEQSIEVATPGRDMAWGTACFSLFSSTIGSDPLQMRKGCQ